MPSSARAAMRVVPGMSFACEQAASYNPFTSCACSESINLSILVSHVNPSVV